MKTVLTWALLLLGTGKLTAEVPHPAAGRMIALSMNAPLAGSAFAARSFPQSVTQQRGWYAGFSLHHYHAVPGLNLRQVGILNQQQRFHWAFFFDQQGDALFRQDDFGLHTGLHLGPWRLGLGGNMRQFRVGNVYNRQLNALLGLTTSIRKQWQLHISMQNLVQRQSTESLLFSSPLQSLVMLQYQQKNANLLLSYRQASGFTGDLGLGITYNFKKWCEVDLSWSSAFRRFSIGMHFRYQQLNLRFSVMHQMLPGNWWNSSVDWQAPPKP